eukprot:GGOE01014861.1.p1 GENE.GGOE01014861.1~~GGOE01014861.1.p1  ORF type:complete len:971 (-),score=279.20 GGOE01014861.1:118-3030(-)
MSGPHPFTKKNWSIRDGASDILGRLPLPSSLLNPPHPRLRLKEWIKEPPDPYGRSRWTLRFRDLKMEQLFVKLQLKPAMETARLLAIMLVIIGLCAVSSAVLDNFQSPGASDWWIILIRAFMVVLPIPLVIIRRMAYAWQQALMMFTIVVYYLLGFIIILVTQTSCSSTDHDQAVKTFVGGELTIFLATAVVPGSGVFLFPIAFIITGISVVVAVMLYLMFSGVLGNSCLLGGCMMSMTYLGYHIILFILAIASAYRLEGRQRQRFALAHQLQLLARKIGKMDLEGAEDILLAQRKKEIDDAAENERLLSIVRQLKQYRPFLPESLFLETEEAKGEEPPREDSNGLAIPLLEDDPASQADPPNTPNAGVSMQPGRLEKRFGVALREVPCTLLVAKVDLAGQTADKAQDLDETFLGIAMGCAQETEGMVLSFGGGFVTVTWNSHHSHPQHQFTACRCAINISRRFKRASNRRLTMGVATGQVLAGITGTEQRKASVVIGHPMHQAHRLLFLNDVLQSSLLLTQQVYEVVQASFSTNIVDFVQLEGEATKSAVYELAGFKVPDRPIDDLYKQAFVDYRNLRHLAAIGHLEKYFAALPLDANPQAVQQAVRLWRSATHRSTSPALGTDLYFRKDGWDHTEEDEAKAVVMPMNLHHLVAPFLKDRTDDDAESDGGGAEETALPTEVLELEAELAMFDTSKTQKLVAPEKSFQDFAGHTWSLSSHLLGQGGFGAVYLGMSSNGKLVAIKAMEIAKENAEEYLNEIKLLMRFRHPNIVGYLGSSIHQSKLMIVMEYVPCGSLDKIIERFRDNLTLSSSRRYLRDILRGLDYLHIHDVVHRDIKPENVLMTAEGECKVADFGTAGTINPEGESIVKGTPHYMAPEVFQGQGSCASDIWSFGVTALQLMTTETQCPLDILRDKSQIMAVMFTLANLTESPTLPASLPAAARSFLTPCFAIDPAARPTAGDLLSHPLCV